MTVTEPAHMNAAFARAFNHRSLAALISLYEADAILRVTDSETDLIGHAAIAEELSRLLQAPGTMTSRTRFCIVHGDLALLRADWDLVADDGSVVASGSSAEVVRRQDDGTWRYVIDHAIGAGLARGA